MTLMELMREVNASLGPANSGLTSDELSVGADIICGFNYSEAEILPGKEDVLKEHMKKICTGQFIPESEYAEMASYLTIPQSKN